MNRQWPVGADSTEEYTPLKSDGAQQQDGFKGASMGKGKRRKLSKKQLAVIEDLFAGGIDEPEVLGRHNVKSAIYKRWLSQGAFNEEMAFRVASVRRKSRMIIAQYSPVAAVKLVELSQEGKGETARKACMDIINMPDAKETIGRDDTKEDDGEKNISFSQKAASRMLEILADDRMADDGSAEATKGTERNEGLHRRL